MSRGVFRSHNKVGETMSFQTNASSATTFDPSVTFGYGSDRVSWDMGDGSGYQADNTLSYIYSDTGTTKTVTLRTNRLLRLEGFNAQVDKLVGNLDMSGWVNLGDEFRIDSGNPELTGITNPVSSQIITKYNVYNCDLTGTLVMTGLTNLGTYFDVALNSNLTSILHGPSNRAFSQRYHAYLCNLTGNLDLSMLTGLGAQFDVRANSLLTGITHTASTQVFTNYSISSNNITGTHDVSMFSNLGGTFYINDNPLLTSITHPITTRTFTIYDAYNCELGYINFLPLSGANMNLIIGIKMEDNNMLVDEVNHILVDFDNISTNLNPAGWTGTTLDISGTNAAPDDGTGGGGDGLAALSSLTGATNNWTITTS